MTEFNIIAIQVKNTSTKLYILSKNFKMGHIRDYDKKGCFMTNSKNCHFAIASVKIINIRKTIKVDKFEKIETILNNDIIIYENKKTINKIRAIIEKISQI